MKDLITKAGDNQFINFKVTCMDCGKDFTLKVKRTGPESAEITGGAVGVKKGKAGEKEYRFKCPTCFATDQNFEFPDCEVYSRVVGYLRPVAQFNDVKQAEFYARKIYKIPPEEKLAAKESKYDEGRK